MIVGQVLDGYGFFISKKMTPDMVELYVQEVCDSLYIEARLRAKGIDLNKDITLVDEEGY